MKMLAVGAMFAAVAGLGVARAQAPAPQPIPFARPQGAAAPPVVITLQDALAQAQKVDTAVQSAITDVDIARESQFQARVARRPTIESSAQYSRTQGNGVTPGGRFISSDGVHVYRAMATVHQEVSPNSLLKTDYRQAAATQAVAEARVEIAKRGLAGTVTNRYYSLIVAQRRYATAQQGVTQAQRFLDLSRQRERAGEAAHSDAVKAELQLQQQRRTLQNAELEMENSRLDLAVLLSQSLNENFTVVDDLDFSRTLPPFKDLQALAERNNPDLKAALATQSEASFDIQKARNQLFPTLSVDANYGLEANALKLHSTRAAEPDLGALPNLGYSVSFNVAIPVFNWGSTRSKIRQAQAKEQQAGIELSKAQRELLGSLYAAYNEAAAARAAIDLERSAAELAAESLRLVDLRYSAGEASVLEVVDAQNTLIEARGAYDEAQVRYRLATASLETLTGSF